MPEIRIYTLETVIAEKLEAMIKLGTLNSRLKDFLYPVLFSLKNKQQFDKEWKNGFWE